MTDQPASSGVPTLPSGGRRASKVAGRRPGVLEILAVLLPLLTVAALALVRPVDDTSTTHAPTKAPLERTTLVCPAMLTGVGASTGTVALASANRVVGEVSTRIPADGSIEIDGTTRTRTKQPLVAEAGEDLAAGLVGVRYGDGSATTCTTPKPEQWFTGVGAGPEHSSTLRLVNPDGGRAVADVWVLGPDGPIDVPALRGVTVPGGRMMSFDLADVVPTRDDLALRVVISRGRLGVDVVDRVDELGRGVRSQEWLTAQGEPLSTGYLLGLGGKRGERVLVLANPGDSEARVGLKVVTKESEFSPADADEIRVAPGTTETVDLTGILAARTAGGAVGLRIDATAPVSAGLRSLAGGDLSHAVAGELIESRAAIAVPPGPARLVLGGASAVGVVTYVVSDETGKQIARERVEVDPGTAHRIKLPGDAAVLDLGVERAGVVAVVEVGPPGLAVLAMTELTVEALLPDVRPALR